MMLVRIISALIGCVIIIPVLIFSHTWVFPIFMAAVTFVSVYEMLRCIGVHKRHYLTIPLCLLGSAMPIAARIAPTLKWLDMGFATLAVCVLFALYILTISLFSHGKFDIETASTVFLTLFYIIGGYTSIVMLRDFEGIGNYIYLLVFVGAWFTDIFAYFTGRFFGKHKLIPEISPKKTVEGSIGGIVFCAIAYVVYGLGLSIFFDLKPNYAVLAIVAVFVSFVAQIGDLTLSSIKRKYGIKDFGNIMPGHGGLLDRFDSIIPVSLLLLMAFKIVDTMGINIFTIL